MGKDNALYKSDKLANTSVKIRKLQAQEDGSGLATKQQDAGAASTAAAAPAAAANQTPSSFILVEEFPAHRAYLYGKSEYLRAMSGWEELTVVCFDVEEHQVTAAQALVHFMYHEALKPDLQLADVGQLLVLADKYKVAACVEVCMQQLQAAMDQGKNCDAVLDVLAVLGKLGSLSSEFQGLFAFCEEHATTLRTTLAGLVSMPYDPDAESEPTQGPAVDKAVGVMCAVFCDMDAAWGQQGLRDILHLFPMEVVRELLLWDGLVCVSKNVVVAAIHHWLVAQPAVSVAEEDEEPTEEEEQEAGEDNKEEQQRREVHEKPLLLTVRVPFLSQTYLFQVLPHLPWLKKQPPLLRAELMAAAGWHMSGTPAGPLHGADKLPASLFSRRKYKLTMPETKVEMEILWDDIHAARLRAAELGEEECVVLPPEWVDGFLVTLEVCVQPPAAAEEGGSGTADVRGHWFWKELDWQEGHLYGDIVAMSSFQLEFSSCCPVSPVAVNAASCATCVMTPSSLRIGSVDLLDTYPDTAEQLAKDSHSLRGTLKICSMVSEGAEVEVYVVCVQARHGQCSMA